MAKYTKLQVLQTMYDQGMVPLFYHDDPQKAILVVKACYDGGARVLEFTHRGDFAMEVFGAIQRYVTDHLDGMILGVGSITDAPMASYYISMGANFIVTPSLREDIAITCNRRKIPYMPGCGTLTEIGRAEELGCDIVKLFPGSTYGPGFIKAIRGPQPWTSVMPTGGVSTEHDNLQKWFDAGAFCVGLGSALISKQILIDSKYNELEINVQNTLSTIDKIKRNNQI